MYRLHTSLFAIHNKMMGRNKIIRKKTKKKYNKKSKRKKRETLKRNGHQCIHDMFHEWRSNKQNQQFNGFNTVADDNIYEEN